MMTMADIAQMRAAAVAADPGKIPSGAARMVPFKSEMRAKLIQRDGQQVYHLHGYANTYEQPYEMYDWLGPYMEVISEGAGEQSLAASPDVAYLVNHRGVTMARTTNGTLELAEDSGGLHTDAYLNPKRQDVKDLVLAIEDKNVTEMSFAFMLEEGWGQWSPDYTEYRINRYDINRGDVSAVNYGANPYTSVAARSREILADLPQLPTGAARAAMDILQHREDMAAPVQGGRSLAVLQALFLAEQD